MSSFCQKLPSKELGRGSCDGTHASVFAIGFAGCSKPELSEKRTGKSLLDWLRTLCEQMSHRAGLTENAEDVSSQDVVL